MSPEDEELDALMERLRRAAAEVGPVPDAVLANAKAAFALRRLDEELAELVSDSAELAGAVRGPGDAVRVLAFESAAVSVELQVERAGADLVVRGAITGGRGPVTVQTPTARHTADLDDQGWFAVSGVAPGPARVLLATADGGPVASAWVML